jgi:predicted AlkP superfamily phosphohydrolase/phosphomutase
VDAHLECQVAQSEAAMHTIILGFDAFDPTRFERLSEAGKLPNLTKYAASGGYARLTVATPPQTEVSWTSIATGLDPGGHGIFDFVHRDPATYTPYVSLLPTRRKLFGTQFVPPFKARTIFEEAAQQGFPATALWWPATFPSRPEALARTIPGLGTPDIQGRIGVGTLFSVDKELGSETQKTSVELLTRQGRDRFVGSLRGPVSKKRRGVQENVAELQLDLLDDNSARLTIGKHTIELTKGIWSPILEIPFRVGLLLTIHALTRVILTQVQPEVKLYALPLQIHPLHSLWRYATPRSFARQTWKECGPFLTLGWPQDTTALEEQCITDEQFLDLCESIFDAREGVLAHQLKQFREGILASIFDSLDRVQHMFWRDRPDIVDDWYRKLDALVGRINRQLADLGREQTRLLVLSDHGFSDFDHRVHLNRWLIDRGYLASEKNGVGSLRDVDWSQSQAYAVGLNSLYLNLAGREGLGSVQPDRREPLIDRLREELLSWQGPDGRPVIQQVWSTDEAFAGPFAAYGPDMVIGYSPGCRASAETGLGKWEKASIEVNHDHWGADHCIDPQAVPGVLFTNHNISHYPHPSYRDIPALTIGAELEQSDSAPPSPLGGEPLSDKDREIIEERLQGLGYL